MQDQIDALLKAFLEEKNRETELVTKILKSLSAGATSRQRMIDEIAAAIENIKREEAGLKAAPAANTVAPAPNDSRDLDAALRQLREADQKEAV